jgi:hypothetical protein
MESTARAAEAAEAGPGGETGAPAGTGTGAEARA